MTRTDGRTPEAIRPTRITPDATMHAEGSVLIEVGHTKVICTASIEDRVPPFLRNTGKGWVTAEYGMLPRSSHQRIERESIRGRVGGRTQEIQRLIGRSLRSVVDLAALGERQIILDCDVVQADGGTRCAAITGSCVALAGALRVLKHRKRITALPMGDFVAAVSVGMVVGTPMLDLDYAEDSTAEVDMNVVMTGTGQFVEVQGTAERKPFSATQLNQLLRLAGHGIEQLLTLQRRCVKW